MTTRLLGGLAITVVFLSAAACSDSGGSTGSPIDCETATVKTYTELQGAFSKCTTCHDSALTSPTDRQAAPVGVDYDTYEGAKVKASDIATQIEQGLMPPSDQPQLTDTERTDLLVWAECGTPE